jgi:hypothetical protein
MTVLRMFHKQLQGDERSFPVSHLHTFDVLLRETDALWDLRFLRWQLWLLLSSRMLCHSAVAMCPRYRKTCYLLLQGRGKLHAQWQHFPLLSWSTAAIFKSLSTFHLRSDELYCSTVFFSMTRQPLGGLGRLIFRGFTITRFLDTPHSVDSSGRGTSSSQRPRSTVRIVNSK